MALQWVIIAILVLIGLSFLKFEHHAKKVKIVFIIIIILLLYFSFMHIFSSNQVDLSSPRGIANGIYYYFGWIGRTAVNLWDIGVSTSRTVGNAVRINNTELRR
jgi:hypothetical protein